MFEFLLKQLLPPQFGANPADAKGAGAPRPPAPRLPGAEAAGPQPGGAEPASLEAVFSGFLEAAQGPAASAEPVVAAPAGGGAEVGEDAAAFAPRRAPGPRHPRPHGGGEAPPVEPPKPKPPEEVTERAKPKKEVDPLSVVDDVTTMLSGDRVGKNDKFLILLMLREHSAPAELDAMRKVFKTLLGPDADMDAWVKHQMAVQDAPSQGSEKAAPGAQYAVAEAEALLSGDPVKGALAALDSAAHHGDGAMGMVGILRGIQDPKLREQVSAEWEKTHGEPLGKTVSDNLEGTQKEMGLALVEGNKAKAEVAYLAGSLKFGVFYPGSPGAVDLTRDLQRIDPKERAETILALAQRVDPTTTPENAMAVFLADLRRKGLSGVDLDMVSAQAQGKDAEAKAAMFESARQGGNVSQMTSVMSSERPAEDASPEERAQAEEQHRKEMTELENAWVAKYGKKDGDLPARTQFVCMLNLDPLSHREGSPDPMVVKRLMQTYENGSMKREDMIRYAAERSRTQQGGGWHYMMGDALKGLDEKQIQALLQANPDLRPLIEASTQGKDKEDLMLELDYGDKTSGDLAKVQKAGKIVSNELEHGGSSEETELRSNKDDLLRRSNSEMRRLAAAVLEGTATPEERLQYEIHARAMPGLVRGWREDEETVAKAGQQGTP